MNTDLVMTKSPMVTYHLGLPLDDWMRLTRIALRNHCMYGDRPSISRMMRNIARGIFTVVETDRLVSEGDLFAVIPDCSEDDIPD